MLLKQEVLDATVIPDNDETFVAFNTNQTIGLGEYLRYAINKNAINTEFPTFGTNTNDSTVKITNYFELEHENKKYLLFLIADFDRDLYYLKIGDTDYGI